MTQKVLMIVGPTAVGKTALSIKLAKKFNGEIISGDSMQVYRNLNIGTAKITSSEMEGVKHYLLSDIDVHQRFSVAEFKQRTQAIITKIQGKNALPILVGGTGFYLQSFVDDFHFGNDEYLNDSIRKSLMDFSVENGEKALWDKLNAVDPKAAQKIPVNNKRRIIRALEVYLKTGKLFSEQVDHQNSNYNFLIIGLNTDRQKLYQRINQRVDQMMEDGLLAEAEYLYDQGGVFLPSGKGIGYKEFYPYFEHQKTLAECIDEVKKNSRHYAKRQLTWFRNKMDVHWFDLVSNFDEDFEKIINLVSTWLEE